MSSKENLLKVLTVKELKKLAKQNRIPLVKEGLLWDSRASRKEDIINVLLSSSRVTKKKIEAIIASPKKKKAPSKRDKKTPKPPKSTKPNAELKKVLRKVKKFPIIKKPKRESELEAMLLSYLSASFPDIRRQLAYERARIDAQIGKVGIELKFQPSAGDFDRLYGQIEKYLKHLGFVIVVIGYEKSKEYTRYFKKRLKERGWLKDRVFIVSVP